MDCTFLDQCSILCRLHSCSSFWSHWSYSFKKQKYLILLNPSINIDILQSMREGMQEVLWTSCHLTAPVFYASVVILTIHFKVLASNLINMWLVTMIHIALACVVGVVLYYSCVDFKYNLASSLHELWCSMHVYSFTRSLPLHSTLLQLSIYHMHTCSSHACYV